MTFFQEQADELASLILDGAELNAEMLYQSDQWSIRLKTEVASAITRLALQGATTELGRIRHRGTTVETKEAVTIGTGLLALPPIVRERVVWFVTTSISQPWWSNLVSGVRDDLATALIDSIHAGDNLYQSAQRVRTVLIGASQARAELIVRTEATGSLNAGADAARHQLNAMGVLRGVEWFAVLDHKTRPTHEALHGTIINIGEQFNVGGERAPYPGYFGLSPEEKCNCRCTSISVLKDIEDIDDM